MTQPELILITIYRLVGNINKAIEYQHIIVNAYKQFPDNFHLKDYPEYPDSETVKKRIYDTLKPKGFVRVVKHNVELTEYGKEVANAL